MSLLKCKQNELGKYADAPVLDIFTSNKESFKIEDIIFLC